MESDNTGHIGVVLLNLGGPDSLEAVRPFLYNLFSDREIIRLGPSFMQKSLAYLISTLRHKKTEGYYGQIGGGSPILDITTAQAKALGEELDRNSESGTREPGPKIQNSKFKIYIAMRYWRPLMEEVIPKIYNDGIRRLIVLSLYPQYSIATTGSSVSRLRAVASKFPLEIFSISSWFDNPLYIDALVDKIRKGLESFQPATNYVHVLFSAHSLPVKFIEEGDPYADQIKETIYDITKRIDLKWDLSYQSKSGPVKWLGPSTDEMMEALAEKGVKNLLVVPISFVSDHIETLYEIDILYKHMADKLGIFLKRAESLNTSPVFISALKDVVLKGLKESGWA